ncbi:MAG: hypothetical protein GX595_06730 [Lentisphaerae bacterium]|nr:hypothetical protein [Lentisphaerota bacterium]
MRCRCRHGLMVVAVLLALGGQPAARAQIRAGLEGLAWQSPETMHARERALVDALAEPMLAARDCSAALQSWFDARTADARGDKEAALKAWDAGLKALAAPLPLLPEPAVADLSRVRLVSVQRLGGAELYLVDGMVVRWTSPAGTQYGLCMVPSSRPEGHRFPLLVYVHGGLEGLKADEVLWLGEQCRQGYVVLAPALGGQPLVSGSLPDLAALRSEGPAGDAAADAVEVMALMHGARLSTAIQADRCAVLGLGHGATVALLAASRSGLPSCVAVAEARRLNPFRAYLARLQRGENTWSDWAAFCNLAPAEQLAGLRRQSAAHAAATLRCPVLLGLYQSDTGGLEEQAHRDVLAALPADGPGGRLEVLPDRRSAGTGKTPETVCRRTLRSLVDFIRTVVPPDDGKDALLAPEPNPQTPGGR